MKKKIKGLLKIKFKLRPVSKEFYDDEIEKTLSYFKLTPISREQYINELIIKAKRKGHKHRQLKFDELEIAYYKSIGIEH